jgi:hypothetical protein
MIKCDAFCCNLQKSDDFVGGDIVDTGEQATNGEEEVRIWDKTVSGSPVNCIKTQGVIPCSPMVPFVLPQREQLAAQHLPSHSLTDLFLRVCMHGSH